MTAHLSATLLDRERENNRRARVYGLLRLSWCRHWSSLDVRAESRASTACALRVYVGKMRLDERARNQVVVLGLSVSTTFCSVRKSSYPLPCERNRTCSAVCPIFSTKVSGDTRRVQLFSRLFGSCSADACQYCETCGNSSTLK
jgi:hypothetical protein